MAFQTGSQVNAALGRTDFTPFLQGALQGAQAQGRAGELIGQSLANLGQQVGQGIEKYSEQKKKNAERDGRINSTLGAIQANVKTLEKYGRKDEADLLRTAGANILQETDLNKRAAMSQGVLESFLQNQQIESGARQRQLGEQAAQYSGLLEQSGGAPVSPESGPISSIAEQQGRAMYLDNLYKQSQIAHNFAATNKQPVEIGVVKVPKTDPDTGITTVSVIDNRTGKELSTYVEQNPITIGAPAPGTVTRMNPDGTITSVAIAGAPKTEEQIKREEATKAQKTAKDNFGSQIKSAFGGIMQLNKMGAMVNPDNDMFTNLGAKVSSSYLGQIVGGAGGTKVASIQKQLTKLQPLMIAALAEATGIKSTQLNSNAELKFYLDAMADPNTDFYSNIAALDALSKQVVGKDIVAELLQDNPALLSKVRRESNTLQSERPLNLGVNIPASSQKPVEKLQIKSIKQIGN